MNLVKVRVILGKKKWACRKARKYPEDYFETELFRTACEKQYKQLSVSSSSYGT
jgi:hypothetical protein